MDISLGISEISTEKTSALIVFSFKIGFSEYSRYVSLDQFLLGYKRLICDGIDLRMTIWVSQSMKIVG